MPEKAQFRRSNISIPKNKTELTNREIVKTRVGRSDNDRNMQNRERETYRSDLDRKTVEQNDKYGKQRHKYAKNKKVKEKKKEILQKDRKRNEITLRIESR